MSDAGFEIVPFQDGADVYIVNTCSVTDHADKKCRKIVQQALKRRSDAKIVIVGCYAQLKPKEISEIPGVNLVLGAAEKFQLTEHLADLTSDDSGKIIAGNIRDVTSFRSAYSISDRTRTFLKVQDGCDYSCTFCTIPMARGKSRSSSIEEILEQAKLIAASGVKEIVLTGVNIGDFGHREGVAKAEEESFLQLIQQLDQLDQIDRFRISSIEPNLLDTDIIQFVAQSRKFVPHFHIPLQSGCNKILKRMRRRYLRELYAERVDLIKSLMPHCCIGVDVITGFPGETNEDFLETYQFLNELSISYLHVFTYSERPNTPASEMDESVPHVVRNERTQQLINLSEKKKRDFYNRFTGQFRQVLFEAETDGQSLSGFTDNYIRVTAPFDPILVNEMVMVELSELLPDSTFRAGEIRTESVIYAH